MCEILKALNKDTCIMKDTKKIKKSNRVESRNWVFVLYPESLPGDWLDILVGVRGVLSPLHDKDTNPDGTIKKAHYHLLLTFEGNKSNIQMEELAKQLNCPSPQVCKSVRAQVRYFMHLDNPEKVQYSKQDYRPIGGFDLDTYLAKSLSEKAEEERVFVADMLKIIAEYDILEYEDLLLYVMQERAEDYQLFKANSFVLANTLKSRRHRRQ